MLKTVAPFKYRCYIWAQKLNKLGLKASHAVREDLYLTQICLMRDSRKVINYLARKERLTRYQESILLQSIALTGLDSNWKSSMARFRLNQDPLESPCFSLINSLMWLATIHLNNNDVKGASNFFDRARKLSSHHARDFLKLFICEAKLNCDASVQWLHSLFSSDPDAQKLVDSEMVEMIDLFWRDRDRLLVLLATAPSTSIEAKRASFRLIVHARKVELLFQLASELPSDSPISRALVVDSLIRLKADPGRLRELPSLSPTSNSEILHSFGRQEPVLWSVVNAKGGLKSLSNQDLALVTRSFSENGHMESAFKSLSLLRERRPSPVQTKPTPWLPYRRLTKDLDISFTLATETSLTPVQQGYYDVLRALLRYSNLERANVLLSEQLSNGIGHESIYEPFYNYWAINSNANQVLSFTKKTYESHGIQPSFKAIAILYSSLRNHLLRLDRLEEIPTLQEKFISRLQEAIPSIKMTELCNAILSVHASHISDDTCSTLMHLRGSFKPDFQTYLMVDQYLRSTPMLKKNDSREMRSLLIPDIEVLLPHYCKSRDYADFCYAVEGRRTETDKILSDIGYLSQSAI